MPPLTRRDIFTVAILGEIVGLFAYAIVQTQQFSLPLPGILPFGLFFIGVPIGAVIALEIAYFLAKKISPIVFQFGKFAAVGFSNVAIDWGVLNLLLVPLGLATGSYVVSKAISYGLATLNSFFWNRSWSFERKGTAGIGGEAIAFYIFTLIGLAINVSLAAFVKSIGPDTKLWAGIASPALATVVSMFWDFGAYRLIVFRPKKEVSPTASPTPPHTM